MIKFKHNEKTNSTLLKIMGLTIGFDEVEFNEDALYLSFGGSIVACLEGELQDEFVNHEYVKENSLVD